MATVTAEPYEFARASLENSRVSCHVRRANSHYPLSPSPYPLPSGGEGIGPAPSPSLRERAGVRVRVDTSW